MDLKQPEQSLKAMIKFRGSLDPTEETVYWWSGSIYSLIPEQSSKHLFNLEGYNISRMIKVNDGYNHLSREMSVYKDVKSGEILKQWLNPWHERLVPVIPIWNDPTNQQYLLHGPRAFRLPYTELGPDQLCFHLEILLAYPSPLPRQEYPLYSQSDLYQGTELFQFYVSRSDLENETLKSVPSHFSWTRISNWLPWMEMADQAGSLVYQCRGYKLPGGIADIPEHLRAFVTSEQQQFLTAPQEFTRPNETSWTYFKKHYSKTSSILD